VYALYYNPGSASFAVHWMLNELQAPHRLIRVDFEAKQQKSAEYLQLNPSGKVPTLIVDGVPRAECAALLLLLSEQYPQRSLTPAIGSVERMECLQWMFYFANTLQPAFRAWFYPHEPAGEAHIAVVKTQARAQIEPIWERVNAHLADNPYFVGNRLSTVDFLATMLMRWSRNMPKPATEWPSIKNYVQRMRSMPSFLQTNRAEGLTEWMN